MVQCSMGRNDYAGDLRLGNEAVRTCAMVPIRPRCSGDEGRAISA